MTSHYHQVFLRNSCNKRIERNQKNNVRNVIIFRAAPVPHYYAALYLVTIICFISLFENVFKKRRFETYLPSFKFIIPRRSWRDIVLASSVRLSIPSVRTFYLSGTISQYLLVRFNSFLVQMISTMDSWYPISLVKIDPLTLELLPLFKYRQL